MGAQSMTQKAELVVSKKQLRLPIKEDLHLPYYR